MTESVLLLTVDGVFPAGAHGGRVDVAWRRLGLAAQDTGGLDVVRAAGFTEVELGAPDPAALPAANRTAHA